MSALTQYNGAFKVLIPMLLAAVQVKTTSPLETHPASFYTFLLSTPIYCFAYMAETEGKRQIHQTNNPPDQANNSELSAVVAFISGSLSAVSLVSTFGGRLFGYMSLTAWAFASVLVGYEHTNLSVREINDWIVQKSKDSCRWLYQKVCFLASRLWTNQPYLFNFSVQKFSPWMSYHAIFVFLIPCLIDLLELKAQGSTKFLFETHSTSIWIFMVAAFIYSFAFAIDRKYHHLRHTISSQLLSAIAIIAGSLSVASLISMIVPLDFQHFSFIGWAFVSLIIVGYQHDALVKHSWSWLHGKIRRIVNKFLEFWNRFKESNKLREQQHLPV